MRADKEREHQLNASRTWFNGCSCGIRGTCVDLYGNLQIATMKAMKTLLSEDQLRAGVQQMADDVNRTYKDRPLTIVGVMTGCIVLLADMIRLLEMPLRVGVVQASSYREGTTSGKLVINSNLMLNITDHDVLVVDDIFDTGNTMVKLLETMNDLKPTSIRSGVLLLKKGCQVVDYRPDFVAFEIPDEFVVGYGIDYAQRNRNLPHIGKVRFAQG